MVIISREMQAPSPPRIGPPNLRPDRNAEPPARRRLRDSLITSTTKAAMMDASRTSITPIGSGGEVVKTSMGVTRWKGRGVEADIEGSLVYVCNSNELHT